MKEKIITLKPKGISQKQWASLLLEINTGEKYDLKRLYKKSNNNNLLG